MRSLSFLFALFSLSLTVELHGLVITEIHYGPPAGEHLEFVEVSNDAPSPEDISGYSFVEGILFRFPSGTVLEAGGVLVVCANADAVRAAYGVENVVGNFVGLLDNGGERLTVVNHAGRVIQSVRYNDQGKWPVGPDGTGHTLVLKRVHLDPSEPENWTSSPELGGSPGRPNFSETGPPEPENHARFNELFRGDGSDDGWVELFNPGSTKLELGGLAVTEDPTRTDKYTISEGTTLEPGAFLVLRESDTSLRLSTAKVQLFLLDPDGGVVSAAAFDRVFPPDAALASYSEARYPDGSEVLWVTDQPTPGAANVVTRVTDIVINELFYNPPEDRTGEFLELYHRGADGAIDLSGFRFDRGIDYTFPGGTSLAPGEYLVLSEDPEVLRNHYGLEGAHRYEGVLANGGENIRLVDRLGNLVDEVRYRDGGRWSQWADGRGASLELIDPAQDNDFASAWDASDDSEKAAWQEFSYVAPPLSVRLGRSYLHMFLSGRGICHIDDVTVVPPAYDASSLLDIGAEWRYRKGTAEFSDPPLAWIDPEFDDSAWLVGKSPIGFRFAGLNTVLRDMRRNYTSVASRTTFPMTQELLDSSEDIFFGITFDDGFCAFLNGVELARENCPDGVTWDGIATAERDNSLKEEKVIAIPKDLLVVGENLLAVVGFNRGVVNNDFFLAPRVALHAGNGPNMIPNPGFETNTEPWMIKGTHIESRRITDDSHSGDACLELVASGKGDNLCNRIEIVTAPQLAEIAYKVSLWARWQRGSSLLILHGEFAPGPPEWRSDRNINLATNNLGDRLRMTVPRNLGTPGEENSVRARLRAETGSDNLGPVIAEVRHLPFSPEAEEMVHVVARVADRDGVAAVRVVFTDNIQVGEFEERELFDDGAHDDGDPGDGVYGGQIPGFSALDRVVFFVEAEDSEQVLRRFPRDAPEKTLVYMVEGPVSETVQIVMDDRNREVLAQRGLHSNHLLDGTFVYKDDEVYYNVGLRYRGSMWSRPQRSDYRVRFPKDQRFHRGRKEINLSNRSIRDTNDGIWSVLISRNSTQATPVPAFDYHYVTARFDGEPIGVPGMWETMGRDFLEKWYGQEAVENSVCLKATGRIRIGDTCSGVGAWDEATLRHMGESAENYRFYLNHAIHQDRDNWKPWFGLTEVMDPLHTSDEDFDRRVFDVLDVEAFLRVLGARMLTGDGDALFLSSGHNGYMVWTPERGWGLLPTDMGITSGSPMSLTWAFDTSLARMLRSAPVLRMHYRLLLEYANGYWSELAWPFLDALEEDSNARRGSSFKAGISAGSRNVKGQLEPLADIEFLITTNRGMDFETTETSVELSGQAGIQVATLVVRVNSEPRLFEVQWIPDLVTRWTGTVDLQTETNLVEVFGFGSTGDVVGTAQITVVIDSLSLPFVRGDVRGDGRVNLSDAVTVLLHLFRGQSLGCRDAADVDDDGSIRLDDVLAILEYLFRGGQAPELPFPSPGRDPSEDDLDCTG